MLRKRFIIVLNLKKYLKSLGLFCLPIVKIYTLKIQNTGFFFTIPALGWLFFGLFFFCQNDKAEAVVRLRHPSEEVIISAVLKIPSWAWSESSVTGMSLVRRCHWIPRNKLCNKSPLRNMRLSGLTADSTKTNKSRCVDKTYGKDDVSQGKGKIYLYLSHYKVWCVKIEEVWSFA